MKREILGILTDLISKGFCWIGLDYDGKIYAFTTKPMYTNEKWRSLFEGDKNNIVGRDSSLKLRIKDVLDVRYGKNGLCDIVDLLQNEGYNPSKIDIESKYTESILKLAELEQCGYDRIQSHAEPNSFTAIKDGKLFDTEFYNFKDRNLDMIRDLSYNLHFFARENKFLINTLQSQKNGENF